MITRSRIVPLLAAGALTAVSALGTAFADETPKLTEILKSPLAIEDGNEVIVSHVDYPPGFTSPVHYHTGHVVVYILEGSGAMEVDGEVRNGGPGDVIEELPEKVMAQRERIGMAPLRRVPGWSRRSAFYR